MYPTIEEKTAVLLYGLAKAHALPNGNKRVALVSTLLFGALNEKWWGAPSQDVLAHVTWVAASEARARDEVLAYLTRYFQSRLGSLSDVGGA